MSITRLVRSAGLRVPNRPNANGSVRRSGFDYQGYFFCRSANGHIRVRSTRGRRPTGNWYSFARNGLTVQRFYRGQTRVVPVSVLIATFGNDYLSLLREAFIDYRRIRRIQIQQHQNAITESVRLGRELDNAVARLPFVVAFNGVHNQRSILATERVEALRVSYQNSVSIRNARRVVLSKPITTSVQVLN
jgi:hypothetical protein